MKFVLLGVIAITTLPGCSQHDSQNLPLTEVSTAYRTEADDPANPANPYDHVGRLHNELSEAYMEMHPSGASTTFLIGNWNTFASVHPEFSRLRPAYVLPGAARVDYFRDNPMSSLTAAIAGSPLSAASKASFTTFLLHYFYLVGEDVPYATLHDFVVAYERDVSDDPAVTAPERHLIWSVTSIVRHTYHMRKKKLRTRPRDRDWDISWGNIAAPIQEMENGEASAIAMASLTGLAANE